MLWDKICTPLNKRGFGVRDLICIKKALVGKQLCTFSKKEDTLWRRAVVAKYGERNLDWSTKETGTFHEVGLWISIRDRWQSSPFL